MRRKNIDNELKAYAVAGTQTVLTALDISKKKVTDNDKGLFMGFRISRKEGNTKPIPFNGSKRFKSDTTKKRKQELSPWQSYLWKDYTADPGKTYTYIFEAMFGTWENMNPGYTTTLDVTTEQLNEGEHSVFFNFGVTGCQAYAKRFARKKIEDLPPSDKEKAFAILGRELFTDGLLKFVAQANSSNYKLFGAFYEIEYEPFLDALKKAQKNNHTEVKIVYSARPDQVKANEEAIKKAGLESVSIPRDREVAQPHNKFMILLENNKPVQVWTGSTNITIRGIFGHSNTGHWIKNEAVAEQYLEYWNMLSQNPAKADFTAKTESIQKDIDGACLTKGTKVSFSPRKTDKMLDEYKTLMDTAHEAVCIIYPFNIEKIFKDFYAEDRTYLRFIITDKGGDKNKIITNDRDVIKTQGAILDTAVEDWVHEITTKTTTEAGTLYVHNKFFIVDPLSASPVVVSGSANFSDESLTNNDENMLIIKGSKRVADIYFTEFSRMFDHFLPRYLQNLKKEKKSGHTLSQAGFGEPLDEKGVWFEKYYDKDHLKTKRKQMFIKMKGAKNG